jgi:hypothetical protein
MGIEQLLILCTGACVNKTPAMTGNTIKDTTIAVTVSTPASLPAGKIIDTVICKSDPAESYAVYIPAKGGAGPLPIIYFFDAHADGALPLNKYKSLADEYGFILVGSNSSKNGNDWPTADNIWRHLSDDAQSRLKINSNRIYTCGFSGGAKVAGYVALKYPGVKGVIANGAGLPDGVPAADFNFSFTAIAGEGDMNMTDLVAITGGLDNSTTRHRIIFFDGKHEWAPESSMGMAFAGLQFDAMAKGIVPRDNSFISRYIVKSKKRLDAYYKADQLVKAGQECAISISFLDGLTDEAGWFKEKASSLAGNARYQKEVQEQKDLLVREQDIKAGYMEHFQQDDMSYWANTIHDLQTKANGKTAVSGMYQRLLAYLSLAFYSFSNRLINSNGNNGAQHFVELYKMADPANSEAWYFSAILHSREGQERAAENDLLRAAGYGFRDVNRMRRQPEFQNLDFSRVESSMRVPLKDH